MKKIIKIVIWGFILVLIIAGIYKGFIKEEPEVLILTDVVRGDVYQKISETGTVVTMDILNLSFEIGGEIKEIFVKERQGVKKGDFLARLDSKMIQIQIQEAKIALDLANSQIKTVEIVLQISKESLENVVSQSETSLNQNYEVALNVLKVSNLQIKNTLKWIDLFQRTYFNRNNQDGIRVRNSERQIEKAFETSEYYLSRAKLDFSQKNIDIAILEKEKALNIILESLIDIQDITEKARYHHIIPFEQKILLDSKKFNIVSALTNLVNIQQTILLIKSKNELNIDIATSQISINERKLKDSKLLISKTDIKINFLENKLQKTNLYSPIDGKIKEINKGVGEIFHPMTRFISLIPVGPFQTEAYIFEEDIVKIDVGDPVEIILIAFPDELLIGRVFSTDPIERLIGGVVHYRITIDFEELKPGIKSGMTADIIIKTETRESVLIVDEDAVQRRDEKFIVQIYKNGLIQERIVEIGLRGEDNRVEIISGLKGGERVIIQ